MSQAQAPMPACMVERLHLIPRHAIWEVKELAEHRFMVIARHSDRHSVYILKKAYLFSEQQPGEQQ